MTSRKFLAGLLLFVLLGVLLWVWQSRLPARPAQEAVAQGHVAQQSKDAVAASERGTDAEQKDDEPETIEGVSNSGLRFNVKRLSRISEPKPPYASAYAALRPGAEEAEPALQYQLGLMLYRCRDVPVQAGVLKSQVDRMYQTRTNKGWEVDDPALEEKLMRNSFDECIGVPAEARHEYREWIQRAAEAGLMDAQLTLMFHLPEGEYCQFIADCSDEQKRLMQSLREEAKLYVSRAQEAGSAEALRILAGWALNDEMGTPNDVEAYAMFNAYDQIVRAAGEKGEVDRMLNSVEKRLRPIDLENANERTQEILGNPNCCVLTR